MFKRTRTQIVADSVLAFVASKEEPQTRGEIADALIGERRYDVHQAIHRLLERQFLIETTDGRLVLG